MKILLARLVILVSVAILRFLIAPQAIASQILVKMQMPIPLLANFEMRFLSILLTHFT
jgi:hypothetical protein